jgi:hypothetical protein
MDDPFHCGALRSAVRVCVISSGAGAQALSAPADRLLTASPAVRPAARFKNTRRLVWIEDVVVFIGFSFFFPTSPEV